LRQQLADCEGVFYALKANSEIRILETLALMGSGFEVASIGEFNRLRGLCISPEKIICASPVKSVEMIRHLYNNGCSYFVFDYVDEYYKLMRYAANSKKILRIFVGDIEPEAIKFGITLDDFYDCMTQRNNSLAIDGITFYLNPNTSIDKLITTLDRCAEFLNMLDDTPKILNIGGNYRPAKDLEATFYQQLSHKLREMKAIFDGLIVYAEPGRSIVKASGDVVTRVELVKPHEGKYRIYIDAGIPTGLLYPPRKIVVEGCGGYKSITTFLCDFFDTTCAHKLLFSIALPFVPKAGNILRLKEMGTYSICKANNFHLWENPSIRYV
jgi:ornithine decarboxylase